jgi:hypothetical protein
MTFVHNDLVKGKCNISLQFHDKDVSFHYKQTNASCEENAAAKQNSRVPVSQVWRADIPQRTVNQNKPKLL